VSPKTPPLRVMLVDDHEIVRGGIRAMLDAQDDIVVTTEAGSVREAVDEAARTRPDVIVMDVRLSDGSGIEATREIRANRPETKVLMLTSFADDEALFSSIMAGASGYVLKQVKSGDLLRAIRAVGAGDSLLDPSVTNAVLDRLRKGKHLMKDEKLARLSPQEERILQLIAEGWTNRQIGDELHLAEKTVKNYVSNLLAKLGMERRTQAAELPEDHAPVVLQPLPGPLEERLPAEVVAREAFLRQLALDDVLSGDAGVVVTRLPERREAAHAVPADQEILNRGVQGVAHVQLASHVRRRDGDHERRALEVGLGRVEALVLPRLLPARFDALWLVERIHGGGV